MIITIQSNNITTATDKVDYDDLINLWCSVEKYFFQRPIPIANKNDNKLSISIDASNIKERLNDLKPDNYKKYYKKYFEHHSISENPLSATFDIIVENQNFENIHTHSSFFQKFIESIFLAMNLSTMGGCNLYNFSFKEKSNDSGLCSDIMESAWDKSDMEKWPRIERIEFSKTWEWLESQNTREFILAQSPTQKAIAVLLHLSYSPILETSELINVSQVLESILLTKNEPKTKGLKDKITLILGQKPNNYQCWISEFYKLRSQIVHGSYPIFRPMDDRDKENEALTIYFEINQLIENGISVILALLQDLILHNKSEYVFEKKINVKRI
jgi:hypothetical protein